jgi:hypothetical protein
MTGVQAIRLAEHGVEVQDSCQGITMVEIK